jgi:hypothetical protein
VALIGKFIQVVGNLLQIRYNSIANYIVPGQEFYPPGFDSKPIPGDILLVESVMSRNNQYVIGCKKLPEENIALPGEARMFSRGDTKAEVYCDNEGVVRLNGNSYSFLLFEFFSAHFTVLINAFNDHVHIASGSPTSTPTVPVSIDISDSKTTTVKTDG